MHKLLLIFFGLLFYSGVAQDEIDPDFYVLDTVYSIHVDSAEIIVREFPADFRTKYSDADFLYQLKTPELSFWDRFMAALAQWMRGLFNIATEESSLNIAVNVVRVISLMIVLLVIYLIVKMILNKEGRWIFASGSKVIKHEDVSTNIHETDFEKLIGDSKRLGEKRLSIRYYYLWMLKKMSERGIITWDPDKTNSDYLYEIANEDQKSRFAYLSYLYDYIWYGEFQLDDAMFDKAVDAFETSIRSIR